MIILLGNFSYHWTVSRGGNLPTLHQVTVKMALHPSSIVIAPEMETSEDHVHFFWIVHLDSSCFHQRRRIDTAGDGDQMRGEHLPLSHLLHSFGNPKKKESPIKIPGSTNPEPEPQPQPMICPGDDWDLSPSRKVRGILWEGPASHDHYSVKKES